MRDEDLLKKMAAEKKVTIDGKEFSIELGARSDDRGIYERNYLGTFSEPTTTLPSEYTIPDLTLKPRLHITDLTKPITKSRMESFSPEVALREGIRAALRGGLSHTKIKEIFDLELVNHVMDT